MKQRSSRGDVSPEQDQQETDDLNLIRHILRCRKAINDNNHMAAVDVLVDRTGRPTLLIDQIVQRRPHLKYALSRYVSSLQNCARDKQFLEKRQPKLLLLRSLIAEHFSRHLRANSSTRVIIFAELRATVSDIVNDLKSIKEEDCPGLVEGLIRPHIFVGQASTVQTDDEANLRPGSSRGLKQKEQQEVLSRFRSGDINVLVATSIAEEGLDIEEVDLLVLFDNVASPGRMMQRMGRTGRKRSGRVVLLAIEGKEELKIEKASESLRSIQAILRDPIYHSKLRLCEDDNPRLIPDSIPLPAVTYKNMNIKEFNGKLIGGSRWHSDQSSESSSMINRNISLESLWSKMNPINISHVKEAKSSESIKDVTTRNHDAVRASRNYGMLLEITPTSIHDPINRISRNENIMAGVCNMLTSIIDSPATKPSAVHAIGSNIIKEAGPQQHEEAECSRVLGPVGQTYGQLFMGRVVPNLHNQVRENALKRFRSSRYDDLVNRLRASARKVKALSSQHIEAAVKKFEAGLTAQEELTEQPYEDELTSKSYVSQRNNQQMANDTGVQGTNLSPAEEEVAVEIRSLTNVSDSSRSNSVEQMSSDRIIMPPRIVLRSANSRFLQVDSDSDDDMSENHSSSSSSTSFHVGSASSAHRSANSRFLQVDSDSDDGMRSQSENQSSSVAADRNTSAPRSDMVASNLLQIERPPENQPSFSVDLRHDQRRARVAERSRREPLNLSIGRFEDHAQVLTASTASTVSDAVITVNMSKVYDCDHQRQLSVFGDSLPADDEEVKLITSNDVFVKPTMTPSRSKRPRPKPINANANHQSTYNSSPKPSISNSPLPATMRDGEEEWSEPSASLMPIDWSLGGDIDPALPCCICLQPGALDDYSPLLQCTGDCKMYVHESCYGRAADDSTTFICDSCSYNAMRPSFAIQVSRCILCKRTDGMMRLAVARGKLVASSPPVMTHIACVLFCPELTVADDMRADNLKDIDCERNHLICEVCRGKGGAVVQCFQRKCLASAHPHCAMASDMWSLSIRENIAADDQALHYDLFCPLHLTFADKAVRNTSSCELLGVWRAGTHRDVKAKAISHKTAKDYRSGELAIDIYEDEEFDVDSPGKPREALSRYLICVDSLHLSSMIIYSSRFKKSNPKGKDKRKRDIARRYFDEEAELSGSEGEASADEEDDEEDDDEVLSGDFINDGDSTQASGISPGLALYRSVNRRKFYEESPFYYDLDSTPQLKFRGAEKGLPIIASILRRKRKKAANKQAKQHDTEEESVNDDVTHVSSTSGEDNDATDEVDAFQLASSDDDDMEIDSRPQASSDQSNHDQLERWKIATSSSASDHSTSASPAASNPRAYLQEMLGDDDW
jgi:hypothetical protein